MRNGKRNVSDPNCMQTAKADLIVSGNRKHLLILKPFASIPIVTAAQAVAMVEAA